METRVRRTGIVGPLLLIGLGVLFLLNNLGLLNWSIWGILFRLWPVALIALGLDILIGRHSLIGSLVVVILLALIVGAVLWYYPALPGGPGLVGASNYSQTLQTDEFQQPLENASRGDVTIGFGAGTLRVGHMEESNGLVEGSISRQGGEQVTKDYRVQGNTGVFTLKSNNAPMSSNMGEDRRWDLRLNPEVPIRLNVNTGVGTSNIDLSSLKIEDFTLDAGVGRTDMTMPSTGKLAAKVNGGIGEVNIVIPEGMAARIQAKPGIGSVEVSEDYQKQGSYYLSQGYQSAANTLDLEVDGGIGKITVRSGRG